MNNFFVIRAANQKVETGKSSNSSDKAHVFLKPSHSTTHDLHVYLVSFDITECSCVFSTHILTTLITQGASSNLFISRHILLIPLMIIIPTKHSTPIFTSNEQCTRLPGLAIAISTAFVWMNHKWSFFAFFS